MTWKDTIRKEVSAEGRQIMGNFMDGFDEMEATLEEMMRAQQSGRITDDKTAEPFLRKKIAALKKLKSVLDPYLQYLERNL